MLRLRWHVSNSTNSAERKLVRYAGDRLLHAYVGLITPLTYPDNLPVGEKYAEFEPFVFRVLQFEEF